MTAHSTVVIEHQKSLQYTAKVSQTPSRVLKNGLPRKQAPLRFTIFGSIQSLRIGIHGNELMLKPRQSHVV